MQTQIIKVPQTSSIASTPKPRSLAKWIPSDHHPDNVLSPLRLAASHLQNSDIPVAFPTETVYGLGADATRSAAVKGIYTAKGRPSDNPLIVHVCDLAMLEDLLAPGVQVTEGTGTEELLSGGGETGGQKSAIPEIYHPLIERFWPGPLTILLPLPSHASSSISSKSDIKPSAQQPLSSPRHTLAPEVSASLPTFGARMPSSALARTLISLTGTPLAAPSANASTRPSPTTAQHVYDDLAGRIELIVDGGECDVGVESTVVDGLCVPPVVLRPGGVGMAELKEVRGWEGVERAYRDLPEVEGAAGGRSGGEAPRAPGMKYKHYTPDARVVLCEAASNVGGEIVEEYLNGQDAKRTVGVIRTLRWRRPEVEEEEDAAESPSSEVKAVEIAQRGKILDVYMGSDSKFVAQGLFSALRALDRLKPDLILIEGLKDSDDIAAAVMNRLRKAADVIR